MKAGRKAVALLSVGTLAAGIWQAASMQPPKPVPVAAPVLNTETENPHVKPPVVRAASAPVSPARLERFASCTPMLRHLRSKALSMVSPYGLEGGVFHRFSDIAIMPRPRALPATGGDSRANEPATETRVLGMTATREDFSTTNVQEEGVDEPDVVKTDGRFIYSITGGRLRAVEIVDGTPKLRGSLGLAGYGHEILLAGDRAVVFATEASPGSKLQWKTLSHTSVSIVELTDPSAMKVIDRLHVEGGYLSARMTGGLIRLVSRSDLTIDFSYPAWRNGKEDTTTALAANRQAIKRSGSRNWLPEYALERGGRTASHGLAVPCSQVYRPSIFAGLGMVTVMTIDPANPEPRQGTTIAADAETVYATTQNLYVAAHRWRPPAANGAGLYQTQIHQFDISTREDARYVASGLVKGNLLNQWSLSEHRGYLRVATTDGDMWAGNSESFISVVERREKILTPVARVGKMGKGERIYSVRFMGNTAYVVTFRQVDPLYVVDLTNPRRPRVRGELKIQGFSSYLHPVGDGLLLGIGQDASPEGFAQGAQVSLFDVSDARRPKRVAQLKLGGRGTNINIDHRAFLWWPAKRMAVVSIDDWWNGGADQFRGAVGLRVTSSDIEEVGRIKHGPANRLVAVDRSVIIGDRLYSVSPLGLMASSLDSLAKRAWIEW